MVVQADPRSLAVACTRCGVPPYQRCRNNSRGVVAETHRVRIVAGLKAAGVPTEEARRRLSVEFCRRLFVAARRCDAKELSQQQAIDEGFTGQQVYYALTIVRYAPDLVAKVESGAMTFSAAALRARGRAR